MKCRNCGNEVSWNARFCGTCGCKVETLPIMENTGITAEHRLQKKKNKGIPLVIGIAVILLVAVFFVWKQSGAESFSPVGTWKSEMTPLELKFKKGGELQVGGFGVFVGGLHWEDAGDDSYYISGEMPELAGISIGNIGGYVYYDREEKVLSLDTEGDIFIFRKTK